MLSALHYPLCALVGVKCIVSAPSGDSGSSDSQDVAADFILHGSVLQVVVIWLDLLTAAATTTANHNNNNNNLSSSNTATREAAMVSQETRAVLEDKISKIHDSRVVVMVRASSMGVFEECQVLLKCPPHVLCLLFAALALALVFSLVRPFVCSLVLRIVVRRPLFVDAVFRWCL